MNTIRTHATNFIVTATAVAAIGFALLTPGFASAANPDGPWPEQPSCSNESGTCSSIEDILAYECFFEDPEAPITWCDDPFELLIPDTKGFAVEKTADPSPGATRVAQPAMRR